MCCWLSNEWHLGLANCLLYRNFLFRLFFLQMVLCMYFSFTLGEENNPCFFRCITLLAVSCTVCLLLAFLLPTTHLSLLGGVSLVLPHYLGIFQAHDSLLPPSIVQHSQLIFVSKLGELLPFKSLGFDNIYCYRSDLSRLLSDLTWR